MTNTDRLVENKSMPLKTDDPYHDRKKVHRAKMISSDGTKVSPACARVPRALNLKVESGALIDKQVTCKTCIRMQVENDTKDKT